MKTKAKNLLDILSHAKSLSEKDLKAFFLYQIDKLGYDFKKYKHEIIDDEYMIDDGGISYTDYIDYEVNIFERPAERSINPPKTLFTKKFRVEGDEFKELIEYSKKDFIIKGLDEYISIDELIKVKGLAAKAKHKHALN